MHQKQLYVDYLTIDPETMDQAETAALRRISRCREKINLLRRLTALNGRYITKRLTMNCKPCSRNTAMFTSGKPEPIPAPFPCISA